jgi:hypothetical protein
MLKQLAVATTIIFSLAACQSGQNSNGTHDGVQEAETAAVEQAPQETRRRYQRRERERPSAETLTERRALESRRELMPTYTSAMLDQDGPGLGIIVDASSLEAFHQSFELVASETSEAQLAALKSAIGALQAWDLSVGPGMEGVLPVIDGMTGDEIIERAHSLRSR